jgi:hypothetical protein
MTRVRLLLSSGILAAAALAGCGKKTEPTSGGGPAPNSAPIATFPTGEAETSGKIEAGKRLTQLGLALHNYHDLVATFPAGIIGPENQLGLSWRVQLLPYLDEGKLFNEFKLDEPWDSAHNKPLLTKMPKVFESPGRPAAAGKTYLQSFFGDYAFLRPLHESGKGGQPSAAPAAGPAGTPARGRRITEITDGTKNTLMVVEGHEPVEWTKPEDIAFVPFGRGLPPVPPLAGVFRGGFHGLMCDGSVHFFPSDLPEPSVAGMITINRGEMPDAALSKILAEKRNAPQVPPPEQKK